MSKSNRRVRRSFTAEYKAQAVEMVRAGGKSAGSPEVRLEPVSGAPGALCLCEASRDLRGALFVMPSCNAVAEHPASIVRPSDKASMACSAGDLHPA